jgi:NAD(P)-dependent dehydrogenase (short-subunit alcohol dehydrogenase family)
LALEAGHVVVALEQEVVNIVITGASRGIGRVLADHFADDTDNRVVGLSRNNPDGKLQWEWVKCDVTSAADVVLASREAGLSTLDALICCAAEHGPIERALKAPLASWSRALHHNVDATYFPLRVFGTALYAAERPVVVVFSGGGATSPRPNFSAYGCAKTALVRLVETVAKEEPWLDINAVSPGPCITDLLKEVAGVESIKDPQPPESVIPLVSFLLSPESDGISGRLISAKWDDWAGLTAASFRQQPDLLTLRRIT